MNRLFVAHDRHGASGRADLLGPLPRSPLRRSSSCAFTLTQVVGSGPVTVAGLALEKVTSTMASFMGLQLGRGSVAFWIGVASIAATTGCSSDPEVPSVADVGPESSPISDAGAEVLPSIEGGADASSSETVDALGAADTGGAESPTTPRPWEQFGFQSPVLNQIALHYLGQAWHRSADVGEVLETIARVDEADPSSWTREWRKTAERLMAVAEESERTGSRLSSSQAYLRAATYFRAALHYHMDSTLPEVRELSLREVGCFEKFLELSRSPCESVKIPYEGTTLPGYFCKSQVTSGPAPVLLFQEGRDGWAEDGRFIADEAMLRGFHVLMFDGPGMGKVLRLQGLPFRPDWEKVVTPVVDYALSRPEVDPARVGLMSVSMGGFLGPRAATREHRLKVLVANPGVVAWHAIYESYLDQLDPSLLPLLDTDPAAFDAKLQGFMQASSFLRWGFGDAMWHHGVHTGAALMKEIRRYNLGADVAQITAHTLVVDAEAEEWGQSKQLYDALTSRKDYLLFTAAETAQFHVQPGASAIATHRLLEWLEKAL